MNTFELTPQQAKITIGALKFRASRKLQQVRSIERKKDTLIEQVGEEEVNHRIYRRKKYAAKIDELISNLSVFVESQVVSQNGL